MASTYPWVTASITNAVVDLSYQTDNLALFTDNLKEAQTFLLRIKLTDLWATSNNPFYKTIEVTF